MKLLHVGCGSKTKLQTTQEFRKDGWDEIRYDIDPAVRPDIQGDMLQMGGVADGSVNAVFSSHNIEHLYPHEVPTALAEFRRVLAPTGYAVITCPDLQEVCRLVAEDKLTDAAYTSPAGPITPLDILYGHIASMQRGNLFMAHKGGFTKKTLMASLQQAGFASVGAYARAHPYYDLWAIASVAPLEQEQMLALAQAHRPV